MVTFMFMKIALLLMSLAFISSASDATRAGRVTNICPEQAKQTIEEKMQEQVKQEEAFEAGATINLLQVEFRAFTKGKVCPDSLPTQRNRLGALQDPTQCLKDLFVDVRATCSQLGAAPNVKTILEKVFDSLSQPPNDERSIHVLRVLMGTQNRLTKLYPSLDAAYAGADADADGILSNVELVNLIMGCGACEGETTSMSTVFNTMNNLTPNGIGIDIGTLTRIFPTYEGAIGYTTDLADADKSHLLSKNEVRDLMQAAYCFSATAQPVVLPGMDRKQMDTFATISTAEWLGFH